MNRQQRTDKLTDPKIWEKMRWGWEDRRQNLPWRAEYETWPDYDQCNYERGRLNAANVIAAGMTPRSWDRQVKSRRRDGLTALPLRIKRQMALSIDMVGHILPNKHKIQPQQMQFDSLNY